jgi:transcription elongation factor Elf1
MQKQCIKKNQNYINMPKKAKLTKDRLECLHCNDVQDVSVIEELFDKTGNFSSVTMYCKACNGKLIARFSPSGFYSFNWFKPDWKRNYNAKHRKT